MSTLQCRNSYKDDRVWRQHSSTIRRLYQDDKKTLKEVKEIMENENGFPLTPISIWEVKLRQLGMRKKLKAKDWSLVYQHVRPRLEQEGRKKLRKPTAILINDTKKPWDDCWREFRRNRALVQGPHRGVLPPLPPGIAIRTPSPEILESTFRIEKKVSSESFLLTLFQTTVVSFRTLVGPGSQSTAEPSSILMYADSVYRLCLEGIPFTRVLEEIPDIVQGFLPSQNASEITSQHDRTTSYFGHLESLTVLHDTGSWKSQLTSIIARLPPLSETAFPNDQHLRLNFDSHHYLSLVVYLLSNGHIAPGLLGERKSKMGIIFQMTFEFVSRPVLFALFQIRLPSIRAAWEELLYWAGRLQYTEAYGVLMAVGMSNNWLHETVNGHEYLYYAVRNHCWSLVKTLLKRGCRPDSRLTRGQQRTAILEALANGNLDCAELLIQHCNVNQEMYSSTFFFSTNFTSFIMEFNARNEAHRRCLGLFLDHGADVDYEVSGQSGKGDIGVYLVHVYLYGFMQERPLSVLDYIYYFHRPLFPKLATFSKASINFSRSRALWCLETGVHVLQKYLQDSFAFTRPAENPIEEAANRTDVQEQEFAWLNILLAEHFLLARYINEREVCYKTVQGLLDLGADLKSLSTRKGLASAMLYTTADLITSGEWDDAVDGWFLMQKLMDEGFQVQADTLEGAVMPEGIAILHCLAGYCSDLKRHGIRALARAVESNNFEAAELLLDGGVDANAAARHGDTETNMFGIAAMCSTLTMMKNMAQRGARPRSGKPGGHPSDVLADMFSLTTAVPDLFAKTQYIIEEHITVDEPFYPSAYLLDACLFGGSDMQERRTIFEFLLKRGARLSPGSPLASWIAAGGGHQLVREMLDAGADINALSSEIFRGNRPLYGMRSRLTPLQAAAQMGDYTLVCWLLDRGADLNPPELGQKGTTALQAICAYDPVRPHEKVRKEKIIELFLEKGEDVNPQSSRGEANGHNALLRAAAQGDLSTAFLLLKHGVRPNSIRFHNLFNESALDIAAGQGRLDMVEFLLNANATSASASSGGHKYAGAIDKAMEHGHFALAELIRKHSIDRQRGWAVSHEETESTTLGDGEKQVARRDYRTAHGRQYDKQHRPGSTSHHEVYRSKHENACYYLTSAMDDGKAGSKVDAESMTGVEMTGSIRAHAVDGIEDESLLREVEKQEALGEDMDWTADQNSSHCEASSGTGGGSHQPEGLVWVDAEEQNHRQLIPESLDADVFMGFS